MSKEYVMEVEDILIQKAIEIRAMKERVGDLEAKVAELGDAAVLACRWRDVAMALMELAGGSRQESDEARMAEIVHDVDCGYTVTGKPCNCSCQGGEK
jgi:hypothetical protein